MKKVISVTLALVLALVCFASCSADKKIIGTWQCVNSDVQNQTLTFNEDGTGEVDVSILDIDLGVIGDAIKSLAGIEMTYTVDGKNIAITYSVNVIGISLGEKTENFTMSFSGDKLTLTNANGTVKDFVRVETAA